MFVGRLRWHNDCYATDLHFFQYSFGDYVSTQTQMEIPRGVSDSSLSQQGDVDDSKVIIARALRTGHSSIDVLREQLDNRLIGASVAMQILKDEIQIVARSTEPVLVLANPVPGKN
jgi:DNA-binding NtrC family response regulator